ncbi:MAG TPA: DUF2784 domain-containing protein [Gemmataceae bacterium]|nr:DUF2784 domain-containing protein [Gemmataceae bacterium]
MYGFLADLMVAIHVGYVGYVVLGQLVIWAGWAFGRQFVRNFWFRATHLLAIGVVAYEEVMHIRCPLTVWEEHFRELAGQPTTGETFLGRLMHSIIFYDFEPWVFTVIYMSTLAFVVLTLVFCPPRWPFRHRRDESSTPAVSPRAI